MIFDESSFSRHDHQNGTMEMEEWDDAADKSRRSVCGLILGASGAEKGSSVRGGRLKAPWRLVVIAISVVYTASRRWGDGDEWPLNLQCGCGQQRPLRKSIDDTRTQSQHRCGGLKAGMTSWFDVRLQFIVTRLVTVRFTELRSWLTTYPPTTSYFLILVWVADQEREFSC